VGLVFDLGVECILAVSREPAENLIHFRFAPALLFGLVHIVRVHAGEAGGVDAMAHDGPVGWVGVIHGADGDNRCGKSWLGFSATSLERSISTMAKEVDG